MSDGEYATRTRDRECAMANAQRRVRDGECTAASYSHRTECSLTLESLPMTSREIVRGKT